MRALLAEDDAILADALSANLQAAGFEVEVADNGAVAEYLLTRQAFEVGIIDLGLPLVDGLTVLQRVRVAKPKLPLIILTALDGLEH
ncbi:MAG: response regulator, partial [Leptothrix sp. (in: b-proteobacteria)]